MSPSVDEYNDNLRLENAIKLLPSLSNIVIIKLDVGISIELEFKLVDEILTENCWSFSRRSSSCIVMLGHSEVPIVYTNGELGMKSSLRARKKNNVD